MRQYLARRFAQSVFLLFTISLISFALIRLAPGGPEDYFLNDATLVGSSPEAIETMRENIREQYGLNDPFVWQYAKWSLSLARLDFGRSIITQRPVINEIATRLPNTLWLLSMGTLLGLLGIPLGVAMARRRGGALDKSMRVVTVLGQTVPHWWLGLLIMLASVTLTQATGIKLIPLPGYSADNDNFIYRLWQLVLPSLLIAFGGWITYSRYVRSQVLEVLNKDYVRTSRAKGLLEKDVLRRHVLRNALIPVITIFGGVLPGLFGGALIFEQVFALPGMGSLAVQSIAARDYPVVMGIVVIASVLTTLGVFFSDVAYALADPRIRYK